MANKPVNVRTAVQGAQQPPAAAQSDDPRDEEIARLRLEVARLQTGTHAGPRLDGTPGTRRTFRVKLPSIPGKSFVKVIPTTFRVGPRQPLPGRPPVPVECRKPYETFDGLQLKLEHGPDASGAAWKVYAAKHGLTADVRDHFKVQVIQGTPQDHLDVPAVSPADAFEVFKLYAGIINTVHQPIVEALIA